MRRAGLLCLLLVLTAPPARAEGFDLGRTPAGLAPSLPGGWKPEVGGWVMYKVAAPNLDASKLYRMACTDRVEIGAKGAGYWLEMADAEPGRGSVVTRMLLVGDLRDQASMQRLMVWAPPQPPFEIPPAELAAAEPGSQGCSADRDVGPLCAGSRKRPLGSRMIKTAAGRFQSRGFKIQRPDGTKVEMWLSSAVPLIGLVRQTSSAGVSWELVGTGRDARSSFPEDVAVLDVAGMRKFSKELEKLQAGLSETQPRDEAHGGTDPLEGPGAPLPP